MQIQKEPKDRYVKNDWAAALNPTKKTNRSLPKGIERFAAFAFNKMVKHHQQESEVIIPQGETEVNWYY